MFNTTFVSVYYDFVVRSEYGGFERLSSKRTTIAELLEEAGYETAGFHSNLYLC